MCTSFIFASGLPEPDHGCQLVTETLFNSVLNFRWFLNFSFCWSSEELSHLRSLMNAFDENGNCYIGFLFISYAGDNTEGATDMLSPSAAEAVSSSRY